MDIILKFEIHFKWKTMKDYPELHWKYDIILLADVIKRIRNNSVKDYVLRSSHYLSTLNWDAMFNIKKGELKHFSDADMYLFFEEGMRGGYS